MPDTINEAAYTKALEAYYAADLSDDMQPFRAAVLAYHKAALPAAMPDEIKLDEAAAAKALMAADDVLDKNAHVTRHAIRAAIAEYERHKPALPAAARPVVSRYAAAAEATALAPGAEDETAPATQEMPEGLVKLFAEHPLPWRFDTGGGFPMVLDLNGERVATATMQQALSPALVDVLNASAKPEPFEAGWYWVSNKSGGVYVFNLSSAGVKAGYEREGLTIGPRIPDWKEAPHE